MGLNAPPNQQPAAPAAAAAPPGNPNRQALRQAGFLYPRWPLLAAFLLTPGVVVGYIAEAWFSVPGHRCLYGAICSLDQLPSAAQLALIWLVFLLLWVVMMIYGVSHGVAAASEAASANFPVARWLHSVSQVERIRWPLVIVGGVIAVLLAVGWLRQTLDMPSIAFGAIGLAVALTALFYHDRPPRTALDPQDQLGADLQQARGIGGVFRSIPPFSWLFPIRATRQPNAGNAGNAAGPTP